MAGYWSATCRGQFDHGTWDFPSSNDIAVSSVTTSIAPRRLRIVSPRYGENIVGGAESLARALARRLAQAGWSVDVFTSNAVNAETWRPVDVPGWTQDRAVRVRRFPVRARRRPALFHQFSRFLFRLPPRLRPERAWIAAQGPWCPQLVRALERAPAIPTLFVPYLYHPTLRGLPRCRGPRLLLPAAHDELPLRLRSVAEVVDACDALWYSTEEERTIVETAHPSASLRPTSVGTVGIDVPDGLTPEHFRQSHGIIGPYLLYGGRAVPGKGFGELLDGFAGLHHRRPDVTLVLTGDAGDGVKLPPGVRAMGRLSDLDRWSAIAGATVVLIPSFQESLSLLALEAWACRRPTLMNGGSPVLAAQAARSRAGITYRGPAELAAAAERLLDDGGLRETLGACGASFVETNYRWDAVEARLVALIESASVTAAARA